jgi:hypothetical protein
MKVADILCENDFARPKLSPQAELDFLKNQHDALHVYWRKLIDKTAEIRKAANGENVYDEVAGLQKKRSAVERKSRVIMKKIRALQAELGQTI